MASSSCGGPARLRKRVGQSAQQPNKRSDNVGSRRRSYRTAGLGAASSGPRGREEPKRPTGLRRWSSGTPPGAPRRTGIQLFVSDAARGAQRHCRSSRPATKAPRSQRPYHHSPGITWCHAPSSLPCASRRLALVRRLLGSNSTSKTWGGVPGQGVRSTDAVRKVALDSSSETRSSARSQRCVPSMRGEANCIAPRIET